MAPRRESTEERVASVEAMFHPGPWIVHRAAESPMDKLKRAFAKRGPRALEDLADDLSLELERFRRRVQSVWEEHHAPCRAWGDLVRDPKDRVQRLVSFIEDVDTLVSDQRRKRAA
ncbi:MAG: hypothetical protein HOJ57_01755 [Lentisphaerae bacterium]|jgi:hypothetical protein|nr:hypothetical protein [Lentisphaerota bacterium]MBT5604633.1 hypothetical protein [Lentisphaerota bacterium]